ncbi:MAG: 50S ribosomal protein L6 [Phycisphaerae bacterium]
MSRIGKKPVSMPSGVKADIQGNRVRVTGPKGELTFEHPEGVAVTHDAAANALRVSRASDASRHRAFHGLTRALLNNMVIGVTQGYERKMEIYGTGYGCAVSGGVLELNVGFSHPVRLPIPAGVEVAIEVPAARGDESPAKLSLSGIDKQVVGQFARTIKDARPPEPYKGKGVRYAGEQIRRKAGKAFAGAAG